MLFRWRNRDIKVTLDDSLSLKYCGLCSRTDREPFSIDLHGLCVQEAIGFLHSFLEFHSKSSSSFSTGKKRVVQFIVGRGNHSANNCSKLGPALCSELKSLNISYSFSDGIVSFPCKFA